jgi:hypothetical protein
MEDYHAAFVQRHQDQIVLDKNNRRIASMHLGGIVIECLLKRMIMASLPRNASQEWKTDSNNPGHTIKNPGHDLQSALKCHNRLYSRVKKFPQVIQWINIVEQLPQGHFIDLRYDGSEANQKDYDDWLLAYKSLIGWLNKQATQF